VQLDYLPGLFSACFFTIRRIGLDRTDVDHAVRLLEAGQGIQRFWLTATRLGLALQPTMAILIFTHYGRQQTPFTKDAAAQRRAAKLASAVGENLSRLDDDLVFMGRIGTPTERHTACRSVRRPLSELMVQKTEEVAVATA
jgi:hypothetical protein